MNVFYEEDGGFKVGHVLTENDASYQVEAAHGKRSKIKAGNVLLKFSAPGLSEFLPAAELEAGGLELDFLWDVAPKDEFGADAMAAEYYGRAPTPVEAAALILRLSGAPMYFHKKGKGRYKAAPEEALKAALASVERKKREAELQARYVEEFKRFTVPAELLPQIKQILFAPDKQSLGFKALESAAAQLVLTPQVLLHRAGVFASAYDFYLEQFLFEHFPERLGGRGFPTIESGESREESPAPTVSGLQPSENGGAFSIDDSSTTEIDDAISVKPGRAGVMRVGIHIAAPGLGFAPESALDAIARRRMSTVYMPGDKITMLPDDVVQRFTLIEGRSMPALSLYVDVNETDGSIIATSSAIDLVEITANLRHDVLDAEVTQENLESGGGTFPFKPELQFLWRFANALEKVRGRPSTAAHMRDYNFRVDWDGAEQVERANHNERNSDDEPGRGPQVHISERKRGAPLDKIVSELMILANSTWGKLLADRGAAGIYRVKTGVGIQGKVRMTSAPAPHIGLGVTHYAWSSSPLRRYVDLVNQWQLIAVLSAELSTSDGEIKPPFSAKSENLLGAIAAFDTAYTAYAEFQDTMERYWCFQWLAQHGYVAAKGEPTLEGGPALDGGPTLEGEVLRDGLVRLDTLPLRIAVAGLPPLGQGARVSVQVRSVDPWRLTLDAAFAGVIAGTDAAQPTGAESGVAAKGAAETGAAETGAAKAGSDGAEADAIDTDEADAD